MKKLLLLLAPALLGVVSHAQLLTWSPLFPVEADPAQNLTITVDASKGNAGLLNHTPTSDVYVHIGVTTNLSSPPSQWKYVKLDQNFNQPAAALQATYLGSDKWQFVIPGSLRSYFGVPAGETIRQIGILFRNGTGTKVQRNSDGSDMYVPIYTSELAARIDKPAREPRFAPVPEPQSWTVGTVFPVEGSASKASTLKLFHNGTLLSTATAATTITANSTVLALGNQEIVLEAAEGTTIKRDTVNLFVAPSSSPTAPLPAGVRDGINYEPGDTSVILVLATPAGGKSIVTVLGDFNNWTPAIPYIMNKTADGKKFWLRVTRLTAGTEYAFQYLVDNNLKIADPYAQKILDPYNNNDGNISAATYPGLKPYPAGQSGIVSLLQTAATPYTWGVPSFTRPDKRGLVIYELLLRDFIAAHDWKTLRDTLGYLKRLGINAIELLPFNEFEGNLSWGYNPDFYFAPDKYYGPKNDLKRFIDSCHANGIAVIMDIALNHSFGLSPMVQLYFDPANNRPAPANPWYNPVETHPFNVGYDFNHESLDTRYFTSRVVEHWLQEYKIDGFRFDLSKGFTQTNSGSNVGAWSAYDASRIAIWKRYHDTVQTKSPGAYTILEHFAENSEEKELSNYGMMLWGNMSYNYQEGAMGYVANSNMEGAIHSVRGWNDPHLISYMESHDEERMLYKTINFGASSGTYNTKELGTALKRAELSSAFFFTIPGPKMLWQFGEVGYDFSINHCADGTINNNCRVDPKPVRWDYLADARRKGLYEAYSKLINLRFHKNYKDAFLTGTVERSLGSAFKWLKVSSGDSSHIMVVGNFDVVPQTGTLTFPKAGTWYDHMTGTTFTASGAQQSITLQPGAYYVYLNRTLKDTVVSPPPPPPPPPLPPVTTMEVSIYPNPIAAGFKIELALPRSTPTAVLLLTTSGQTVKTVSQQTRIAGRHTLSFDRKALGVASGVYYLKVVTLSGTKIIPIILQ
ncbi:MAG TPA: alpha-amylase family glycosyl hydrolase [Flavisolibacter sp.]